MPFSSWLHILWIANGRLLDTSIPNLRAGVEKLRQEFKGQLLFSFKGIASSFGRWFNNMCKGWFGFLPHLIPDMKNRNLLYVEMPLEQTGKTVKKMVDFLMLSDQSSSCPGSTKRPRTGTAEVGREITPVLLQICLSVCLSSFACRCCKNLDFLPSSCTEMQGILEAVVLKAMHAIIVPGQNNLPLRTGRRKESQEGAMKYCS